MKQEPTEATRKSSRSAVGIPFLQGGEDVKPSPELISERRNDAPLFQTLGRALSHAYESELHPASVRSQLGRLLAVSGSGDMSAMDWHAQAGMILAHIDTHLRPMERSVIEAYYRRGTNRFSAINSIARSAGARVSSDLTAPFLRALCVRFFSFGQRGCVSLRTISIEFDINEKTCAKWYARVAAVLRSQVSAAEDRLVDDFTKSGLIAGR